MPTEYILSHPCSPSSPSTVKHNDNHSLSRWLVPIDYIILRSYDTLYRWHLLGIGQTKIIYYNITDVNENIDKKLNFIEYVPILIIPAYYK